jgi:hypothetical protein
LCCEILNRRKQKEKKNEGKERKESAWGSEREKALKFRVQL